MTLQASIFKEENLSFFLSAIESKWECWVIFWKIVPCQLIMANISLDFGVASMYQLYPFQKIGSIIWNQNLVDIGKSQ